MKPIQLISQDLFDKVRSRFQNLEMGDETGAVTIDPAEARFFDFDFVNENVNLGRVSISLNDLGSLKIYYSQGITENQDDPAKQVWYGFLKEMRLFAMRRLLRFDTRDVAKSNLDKNDFQHLATTQGPKEEDPTMNMNESRWNQKSTKKTSRAVKGATEVIVRHAHAVDETYPGARSQRKNIKAIFIQNSEGERFKYPFIHPAGAFAMAQHIDHGGIPHDHGGKAIIRMSEQIAQLQEFQRQVQRSSLHDDAMGITDRAVGRLNELKATIEGLSKRHHYESWLSELDGEAVDQAVMELDPVTMETYKSKFTETNFKEDLASFFPLLHSIMQETNTVDLEDYVKESTCSVCHKDPCQCDDEEDVKEDAFNEFAEWAEAVEQGKLTDDQVEDLKQALAELPNGEMELGPDGQTSFQFFSSFGLEDTDLEQKLKAAADLDPGTDPIEVLQVWAKDNYPELLVALGISNQPEEVPPQDPAAAAPVPAPAPEAGAQPAPVAEGKEGNMVQEVAKIVKSFYNRDNPEVGPFRGGEGIVLDVKKSISEKFGDEAGEQAAQIAEKFMNKLTQEWQQRHGQAGPVEPTDGLARLKELVGNIKGRVEEMGEEKNPQHSHQYDTTMKHADNPSVQQRMAAHDIKPGIAGYRDRIDMLKDLERTGKLKGQEEAYNPNSADAEHRRGLEASHEKHLKDKAAGGDKGAQARLDALAQKKERMKNDYNDRMEREGVDKSQVPAYLRKEKGGDWKMSTKDLEKEKTNSPTSSAGLARKKAELGISEELSAIMKLSGLAK